MSVKAGAIVALSYEQKSAEPIGDQPMGSALKQLKQPSSANQDLQP